MKLWNWTMAVKCVLDMMFLLIQIAEGKYLATTPALAAWQIAWYAGFLVWFAVACTKEDNG